MRFEGGVSGPAAVPLVVEEKRRRGWLPFAAVRPDYDLIPLNGKRLLTEGLSRRAPAGTIAAVAYRAELRPSPGEVVKHLIDRDASVLARTRITGGVPVEEYERAGAEHSEWSMDSAVAAAAGVLGRHVSESGTGARIESVRQDVRGVQVDDVVISVDGQPVRTATEVRSALAGRNAVALEVSRAGQARPVSLVRQFDGAWGLRVVTSARSLQHGIAARFDLPEDLRGPSLGLACALSIVDAYTGGQLAGSGTLVATGAVDLTGRVGAVGAIEYKARAVRAQAHARRFVVPAEVPDDAEAARRILGGRVEVVAVTTLREAVDLLGGPAWRSRRTATRSADRIGGAVR